MIQCTSWLFGPFGSQYPVIYQFSFVQYIHTYVCMTPLCLIKFVSAFVSASNYKFSVIWVFFEGFDNKMDHVCCKSRNMYIILSNEFHVCVAYHVRVDDLGLQAIGDSFLWITLFLVCMWVPGEMTGNAVGVHVHPQHAVGGCTTTHTRRWTRLCCWRSGARDLPRPVWHHPFRNLWEQKTKLFWQTIQMK